MTDLRNEARETERTMQSAPQDLLDKVSFGFHHAAAVKNPLAPILHEQGEMGPFSVWSGSRGSNVRISPIIHGSGTVLRIMDTPPPYLPLVCQRAGAATRRWSGGVQAEQRPCGTTTPGAGRC